MTIYDLNATLNIDFVNTVTCTYYVITLLYHMYYYKFIEAHCVLCDKLSLFPRAHTSTMGVIRNQRNISKGFIVMLW